MNKLQIFKNESFGEVRVAGSSEQPLFCLADVCRILDLKQFRSERLSDDVISNQPIIDSLGREQQALFVNEDGLYDVILDSRKPEAKQFRKWVTGEVLPSIRQHGAYMTEQTLEKALLSPDYLIQLATQLKDAQEQRRLAESKAKVLEEVTLQQAPKVLFAEAVLGSTTSCLVGELAKLLTQNGINIGQNNLFKWMRRNEFLGRTGERYNIPNQQYVEQGLFELKKSTHSDSNGVMHVTTTVKLTPKGQSYFINGFLSGKFQISTSKLQSA